MLGAEEFGFATAPLITLGCCMMRVCNLDTCPVGVATQNPKLRARFAGKPEYVMNFMRFVAQEMRECMALVGVRTVDELVGRSDLLTVREKRITPRAETVDLSALLVNPFGEDVPHFAPEAVYRFKLSETKDCSILLEKLGPSLTGSRHGKLKVDHPLRLGDHPRLRRQPARGQLCHPVPRRRRPVLRCLHPQGPDPAPGGRQQRRLRQGTLRRQAGAVPAQSQPLPGR